MFAVDHKSSEFASTLHATTLTQEGVDLNSLYGGAIIGKMGFFLPRNSANVFIVDGPEGRYMISLGLQPVSGGIVYLIKTPDVVHPVNIDVVPIMSECGELVEYHVTIWGWQRRANFCMVSNALAAVRTTGFVAPILEGIIPAPVVLPAPEPAYVPLPAPTPVINETPIEVPNASRERAFELMGDALFSVNNCTFGDRCNLITCGRKHGVETPETCALRREIESLIAEKNKNRRSGKKIQPSLGTKKYFLRKVYEEDPARLLPIVFLFTRRFENLCDNTRNAIVDAVAFANFDRLISDRTLGCSDQLCGKNHMGRINCDPNRCYGEKCALRHLEH